jgi:hypothetical protein
MAAAPRWSFTGPQRLAVARALAWCLWLGAWLVLGTLGRHWSPLWAGGVWPMALCLLSVGAGMAGLARGGLTVRALRGLLLLLALWVSGALLSLMHGGGAWALVQAAIAWGLLLVAASQAVKQMRQGLPRAPAPVLPALAGAVLAWGLGVAALRAAEGMFGVSLVVLGLGGGLAAMVSPAAQALRGCRAGLFDCAWPVPPASAWQAPRQWPLVAARLSMLPMMAALPLMGEWCATALSRAPAVDLALHLAAMLLPAAAVRLHCPGWLQRHPAWPVLGLQWASVAALMWQPGMAMLSLTALLQAMAWSLAWSIPLLPQSLPDRGVPRDAPHGALGLGRAALAGAGVVAWGASLAEWGPVAWMAAQWVGALLALAGAVIVAINRWGRWALAQETSR